MARIVEIAGVSGVGKSALYDRISRSSGDHCPFGTVVKRELKKEGLFSKGYLGSIFGFGINNIIKINSQHFVDGNQKFCCFLIHEVNRQLDDGLISVKRAYKSLELFQRTFGVFNLSRNYDGDKLIIVNEGFVQRIRHFWDGFPPESRHYFISFLREYVDVLFVLTAPADVILERYTRRTESARSDTGDQYNASELLRDIESGLRIYSEISKLFMASGGDSIILDSVDSSQRIARVAQSCLKARR